MSDGTLVSATRATDSPNFEISVRYSGDGEDTVIPLHWLLGEPRYVLLYNPYEPDNAFKAGDAIATRLDVPAGQELTLYQALKTCYEQIVPTLDAFQAFLRSQGHGDPVLWMGPELRDHERLGHEATRSDPARRAVSGRRVQLFHVPAGLRRPHPL